jgi:plasmid stabilization system protein ParE
MVGYTLSETAQQDIEAIVEYIFKENPSAALAFEFEMYNALDLLADNPTIGHTRTDLTDRSCRFWTFKKPYEAAEKGYGIEW